jgi:hypothetical protein
VSNTETVAQTEQDGIETVAVRVLRETYEELRTGAFHARTTIREYADTLIREALDARRRERAA